jgi:hypothetical protein
VQGKSELSLVFGTQYSVSLSCVMASSNISNNCSVVCCNADSSRCGIGGNSSHTHFTYGLIVVVVVEVAVAVALVVAMH